MIRACVSFIAAGVAFSLGSASVCGQVAESGDFVVLSHFDVNIRNGPGLDEVIVGRSDKGTLFPLIGETGDWYEIRLFSDVPRYVSKSLAYHMTGDRIIPGHRLEPPAADDMADWLISAIQVETGRAEREAEALLPLELDAERHETLRKLLVDRNLLNLFEDQGIQPAVYWLPEAETLRP